jgi:hypothetical protein
VSPSPPARSSDHRLETRRTSSSSSICCHGFRRQRQSALNNTETEMTVADRFRCLASIACTTRRSRQGKCVATQSTSTALLFRIKLNASRKDVLKLYPPPVAPWKNRQALVCRNILRIQHACYKKHFDHATFRRSCYHSDGPSPVAVKLPINFLSREVTRSDFSSPIHKRILEHGSLPLKFVPENSITLICILSMLVHRKRHMVNLWCELSLFC